MGANDKPRAAAGPAQDAQLVPFREEGKGDLGYGDL